MDIVKAFTHEGIDQIREPRRLNPITIGNQDYRLGPILIPGFVLRLGRIFFGLILIAAGRFTISKSFLEIGNEAGRQ